MATIECPECESEDVRMLASIGHSNTYRCRSCGAAFADDDADVQWERSSIRRTRVNVDDDD